MSTVSQLNKLIATMATSSWNEILQKQIGKYNSLSLAHMIPKYCFEISKERKKQPSLKRLIGELIHGNLVATFHNAGNDSAYTLLLFAMYIYSYVSG